MEQPPPEYEPHEEIWVRIRREQVELEARYKAINQAWRDSRIPVFVLQTPDWQSGWRALHVWLGLHDIRARDLKIWESVCSASWPRADTAWAHEIHVFSHVHSFGGHGPEHATIEEEGTRAILAWWNERSAKSLGAPYHRRCGRCCRRRRGTS